MDILGPNLHQLYNFCNRKFSEATFSWLAYQMISRVESVHSKNYVHRDLKPENFLIGTGKKSNTLYLIDMGLAKRYVCPKTGQHIEQKKSQKLSGTMLFRSASAHKAYEQSRKDDLISLGHIFIYFLN